MPPPGLCKASESGRSELAKGLKAASGFIRRELASGMNLRITPELSFVRDDSITYGAHIASILNRLDIPEDDGTSDGNGNEDADH